MAVRRFKEGFARTNGLGAIIAMEQETWEGDTLPFRMRAFSQTVIMAITPNKDQVKGELKDLGGKIQEEAGKLDVWNLV